jgi:hypothetical protein
MEKLCSCCNAPVDSENAPILALGGFGNAKYLCDECDGYLNIATRGRDVNEINEAMDAVSARMRRAGIEDGFVLRTVESIMKDAQGRRDSIARGEYDFSVEEESDGAAEEIPEELRETEEDRLADERELEEAKKWDKVITIVSAVIFSVVIIYFIYRFIDGYFF